MNNPDNYFNLPAPPNVIKKRVPDFIKKTTWTHGENDFIRFEEKKERYVWALPAEICFVKSADHYIKSLVQCGSERKWMSRHCTIKDLLNLLPEDNFIRLNKFYLLNRNHFSCIVEKEKILYLTDDFSIPIPHRISPYLRHLLKTTCT